MPQAPDLTVMSAEKSFHCRRCDRRFARLEHLQRHERSHTKEKPFLCLQCQKGFTRKDLLRRHERLGHQPGGEQGRTSTVSSSPRARIQPRNQHHISDTSTKNLALPVEAFDERPPTSHLTTDGIVVPEMNNAHFMSYPHVSDELGPMDNRLQSTLPSFGLPLSSVANDFDTAGLSTLNDFSSFLDSIPLPTHPFSPIYQPWPLFYPEFGLPDPNPRVRPSILPCNNEIPSAPELSHTGLSRFGSRLPSLEPESSPQGSPHESGRRSHVTVTPQSWESIMEALIHFSNIIPEHFTLPSRHAMSRYIAGYFRGFHDHYPILHVPTLQIGSLSAELLLAIAALGAQYCREPDQGLELFHVAKLMAIERLRRHDLSDTSKKSIAATSDLNMTLKPNFPDDIGPLSLTKTRIEDWKPIQTIQCLLLLIALATWFEDRLVAREALSIRSTLDSLVRQEGLKDVSDSTEKTWEEWIQMESMKRTKFIVFCFFNLHTIVFDLPPMILSNEISIDLPCTEAEWKASTVSEWRKLRSSHEPESGFEEAFCGLFGRDHLENLQKPFSSLGAYVLIHVIIQNIWLIQQSTRLPVRHQHGLALAEVTSIEQALKRWCLAWEGNQESSLDPMSPHGPLSFNSTALLRLAYIRINLDVSSIRCLGSWDPRKIAQSLSKIPPVQRSGRLTRAALHCAHALSIPIKLGIKFVAQTQVASWSNQHALCSLECALLLAKWLEAVSAPGAESSLTNGERDVLNFVVEMVAETEYRSPPEKLLENHKRLSAIAVRLWAKLFSSDSVWEMVGLIGRALNAYADLLQQESA